MIEFAGIRSDEKYLIVEHYPKRYFPKRRYTVQAVPGRSGDVVIEESDDAFDNYTQPYEVFLDSKAPGLQAASRGLSEWLLGNSGYQRLEDNYDPDCYRYAYYSGGEQFLNHFNEYGRGTLTFNCAPKRFFKLGDVPVALTNGQKLYSPSQFKARPIVLITGSGTCNVSVTDKAGSSKTFTIRNVSGTVEVDVERHKAIKMADNTSMNADVQSPYENLILSQESTIGWSGGTTGVIVIPRWWTI